jgi:ATP-dependent DNA helicase RecG
MSLPKDWQQVFNSEAKQGYLNSGVIGGFSEWVSDSIENIADNKFNKQIKVDVKILAKNYAEANLLERPIIFNQISALLETADWKVIEKQENKQSISATVWDSHKTLETSIQFLKGVGPKKAVFLRKLGINTVGELLFYFPRDYEFRGKRINIGDLQINQSATIQGRVLDSSLVTVRKGLAVLKALISDGTGSIQAVWFNQKYLKDKLVVGREISLFGKIERRYNRNEFYVQDFEFIDGDIEFRPQILPIYPTTGGLSQKNIRAMVNQAWDKYGCYIAETLPNDLLEEKQYPSLKQAICDIHFPNSKDKIIAARNRLAYEELLVLQLAVLANRIPDNTEGIARPADHNCLEDFTKFLKFPLTNAQKRVIDEIFKDLEKNKPMARLVQGDVGSGKTIVAAAALYKNARAGYQGAMMVPTEILAVQHYTSLAPMFSALGYKVELFTGETTGKERKEILTKIKNGDIDIVIGTHTLVQKEIEFKNLALAITDEQHRFGVMQRSVFQEKGRFADTLVMTATPIPRTLAMTLYGDLDVSVIDELPPGRKTIETYAVDYGKEERALNFIKKELDKGRQAYIVCPLVDESEKLEGLESAVKLFERLSEKEFKHYDVGLLHGQMKPKEKEALMRGFVDGVIQVLVATTVIEVGINVPNATIMMIRDAERFGLAQLHQLRGRVGRGSDKSYCILLHNAKTPVAKERMKTMHETGDGFKIAEADLKLRGAGEFFGTRQSGIAEMKIANLARDVQLMAEARKDALRLLDNQKYKETILYSIVREKIKILNS